MTKRFACLAILGLTIPVSGIAASYDAVTGFSSSNPSGPWAYGTGVTGSSFTPMSVYSTPCNGVTGTSCWQPPILANGVPAVLINNTGTTFDFSTVVLPTDVLLVHPGPSVDTIVTWTAPTAGVYSISGFFELLDISPTGVIGEVYNGSTPLFTGSLTGPAATPPNTVGQRENFSFVETLAAGSVLSFGVSNAGSYLNDSTGFDALITPGTPPTPTPEPSSLMLLAAGLGGLAYRKLLGSKITR